jgi:predicted metal-dependent hydrolase
MHNREQFLRGIEEFNQGMFFECHDTLEEIWMEAIGSDRLFLQGLIQVSVGFYHASNGNFKGAESQLRKGIAKLESYQSGYCGVELTKFLEHVALCLHDVAALHAGTKAGEFDLTQVPNIEIIDDTS